MEREPRSDELRVEATLPRPWGVEASFHDTLYEWMRRAPWLAISLAAHLLVLFVLAAIPWEQFQEQERPILLTSIEQQPEPILEQPEEPIEPVVENDPIEEPVLQDADVPDSDSDPQPAADDLALAKTSFTDTEPIDVIGVGSGAGDGLLGERFAQGGAGKGSGRGTERALADGLDWLAKHQSEDGSWDCDGFMQNCGKIGATVCGGPGKPTGDVAMTGLALLAFLGNGNTTLTGPYRDVVVRGVQWLRSQQDPDTGILGSRAGESWVYDHAMGTLALCEAYYFSKSPLLKETAQDAVDLIGRMRNPHGVWRYDHPPLGDNDTSITGWMLMCLKSAKEGGLRVDEESFEAVRLWLDEVTDPSSGRVGYRAAGSLASRVDGVNDHWSPRHGESLTAVGLLVRIFLGQEPDADPILLKHADLIASKPPAWNPDEYATDVYYWYYGTYAMYQMGGKYWRDWNAAMKSAVVDSQRGDGDEKGSWDPQDAWGWAGGRVYETALMLLCLEVYFRYAKVLGAR